MFVKGFNFLFGKIFNSNHTYITSSLNYSNSQRNIDRNYLDYIRLSTLELVSREINDSGIKGAVAELGVYKGKFARYINRFFPDRKLYLFDTFKGFSENDVQTEKANRFSEGDQDFSNTSVRKVLEIMPHPGQCIVREGYFPQTAEGIQEEFVFVSIDTDLYDPIYNGLVYFYPRLVKGGYIFVHDYNNDNYSGAKKAVQQFCRENQVSFTPLPDTCGTAVISK